MATISPTPLTTQQTADNAQIIKNIQAGQGYNQAVANVPTSTSLGAGEIGNTNPMVTMQPKPLTQADGLSAVIETGAQQFSDQFVSDQKMEESRQTKADSKQTYYDKLLEKKGKNELMNEAAKDSGLDPAKKELNDINNQILQEQNSVRRQMQELEANQSITKEQAAVRAGEINRRSASKQADLSIIQMAKQNNYTQAKEIADRQVSMKLEQQQNDLEAYKYNYEENKDQFTKDEDRKINAYISERERLLKKQEGDLKTISDTKLALLKSASEQGAPLSVLNAIQSSDTADNAIVAAGQYGGDILQKRLQQAQLDNVASQIKERNTVDGTKMNATQATAAGFGNRMIQSNKIIDEIGGQFTGVSSYVGSLNPFNAIKSSDRQRFEQAQRDFINAVLRKESGAAIGKDEFKNAERQYFPQPGDGVAVQAQKKNNRIASINSLLIQAGQNPVPVNTNPLGLNIAASNPLGI